MIKKYNEDPRKDINAISEKCAAAKSFVLFAAVKTDKKDKDGNFVLEFHYTRHRYNFEDLPKSFAGFRELCKKDAMNLMDLAR